MIINKFTPYDYEQQLVEWKNVKKNLDHEQKVNLLKQLIDQKKNIFSFLELISCIGYEVATASKEYLSILENISKKVKNDLAQGPFLNMLIRIGKESVDAEDIRLMIIEQSDDNNLKILSGLILGGLGIKKEKQVLELIYKAPDNINNLCILRSYLRALIITTDKKKVNWKEYLKILEEYFKLNKIDLDLEIISFCIYNYQKNKNSLYDFMKKLIKRDNEIVTATFFDRISYKMLLDEKRFFELAHLAKNSNEKILDLMIMSLRRYPKAKSKILDLYFYWINKGVDYKISHFDWVLEEIMKKEPSILNLFLMRFHEIKNISKRHVITPHLFESLAKQDTSRSLKEIKKLRPKNKRERLMIFNMYEKIIGLCYENETLYPNINELAKILLNLKKSRNYISAKIDKNYLDKSSINKKNYDSLVNQTRNLLDQLRTRSESFNYPKIYNNLEKYKVIKKICNVLVNDCENEGLYSPLLDLLEKEEPDTKNIEILKSDSDQKKVFKQWLFYGGYSNRAYLTELEKGCNAILKTNNGKYTTKEKKIKYIQEQVKNEQQFWNFISEIVFMNKIGEKRIVSKDFKTTTNDLDFKTNIFGKTIFFEVTSPETDRNLRLANGAVALGNKSISVIDNKYSQIVSGVYGLDRHDPKTLFYIVIDITNNTIDEYMLMNSLFGTEVLTMIFDKAKKKSIAEYLSREKDALGHKKPKAGMIGGVIYFKRDLNITENGSANITLKGNIINNPLSSKVLNDQEVKAFKKILFNI